MSAVNTATVSGRITRDPELRHTPAGTAVLNNAVAVEEYVKDGDNGVSFFDFTVWGNFAEMLARKIQKGDNVTVSGRLTQRSWEADDGTKRSKVEIVAQQVVGEFIYRKADENGAAAPAAGSAAEQAADAAASDDDIPF